MTSKSDVASRLGVSNVWLAKTCRAAAIPLPPRGYWARKQAGQKLARFPFPPREPGHADELTIGQTGYNYWRQPPIDESEPEAPAPVFDEPIETVCARVEKRTEAVRVSPDLTLAHRTVRAALWFAGERFRPFSAVRTAEVLAIHMRAATPSVQRSRNRTDQLTSARREHRASPRSEGLPFISSPVTAAAQ